MKTRTEAVAITAAVLVCLAATELPQAWAQSRPDRNGWIIRESRAADRAYFGIDRSRQGDRWTMTTDLPWNAFRGLDAATLRGLRGARTFELRRDAGTVICAGNFSGGRGSGTYTFEPSPSFVTGLSQLGYAAPSADDLFSMAFSDVSLDFAQAVRQAGLSASVRDLLEMRSHGVAEDFLRAVREAGYGSANVQEIIELRNHGVDARYLAALSREGVKPATRDLVAFRDHGVTPEFLKAIRDAGYPNLDPGEIIELRNHGLDARFLAEMSRAGLKLSVQDLIELRNHGVSPEFLKETQSMGYKFTVREAIEMSTHGVNAAYLRKLKASGFDNLSPAKIIRLRDHGID